MAQEAQLANVVDDFGEEVRDAVLCPEAQQTVEDAEEELHVGVGRGAEQRLKKSTSTAYCGEVEVPAKGALRARLEADAEGARAGTTRGGPLKLRRPLGSVTPVLEDSKCSRSADPPKA